MVKNYKSLGWLGITCNFVRTCTMQEELILEIVNNANCQPKMHQHSYLRSTIVMVLVTLMVRNPYWFCEDAFTLIKKDIIHICMANSLCCCLWWCVISYWSSLVWPMSWLCFEWLLLYCWPKKVLGRSLLRTLKQLPWCSELCFTTSPSPSWLG